MTRSAGSRSATPATSSVSAPGPIRTCIGCRHRDQPTELLRVVAEDGKIVPDPRRRRPGRGAWLHPITGCLDAAERRRAFGRALRSDRPLDTSGIRQYLSGQDRTPVPPDPHGADPATDQESRSTQRELAVKSRK